MMKKVYIVFKSNQNEVIEKVRGILNNCDNSFHSKKFEIKTDHYDSFIGYINGKNQAHLFNKITKMN